MKKIDNKGFALVETLVVTIFVASVLIFLHIQFSKLDSMYNKSYKYNTVEGLYALQDIKEYLEFDGYMYLWIEENLNSNNYLDIRNCGIVSDQNFCLELMEAENIKEIFITKNTVPKDVIVTSDEELKEFINLITTEGIQPYRLIASFNNSTYATLRFGD